MKRPLFSDFAFQLLSDEISSASGNSLWIVDENISQQKMSLIKPRDNLWIITNRYDAYQILKRLGFNTGISDFEFSEIAVSSLDNIFYRTSKEKAIVHHIINQSKRILHDGGLLFFAGYKGEGTKTYISKASDYLGELRKLRKGDNKSMLAVIANNDCNVSQLLDDKNYVDFRDITIEGNGIKPSEAFSKPGIFGWNKIDKGSEYLVSYLPGFFERNQYVPKSIVDLGCGYGYITIKAHQLITEAKYLAIDNNVAAVNACEKNFEKFQINGKVFLDDCGISIQEKVELVLCNPPFHQGFDVESDLMVKFLSNTRRLLLEGGIGLFVVNSFIPLEKKAKNFFSNVAVVDNNGSFKLVEIS